MKSKREGVFIPSEVDVFLCFFLDGEDFCFLPFLPCRKRELLDYLFFLKEKDFVLDFSKKRILALVLFKEKDF